MLRLFVILTLAAQLWGQTVINGSRAITGAWDASGATSTKPARTGTSDPATCAAGELFYRTDTGTLKHCSAANTWTAVGGSYTLPTASASTLGGVKVGSGLSIDGAGVLSSSGGSGPSGDPTDLRWVMHREDCMSLWSANGTNTTNIQGEMTWYTNGFSGSGFSVSGVQPNNTDMNDAPKHPGQWVMATGSTSGTQFSLYLGPYSKTSPWLDASTTGWKACWVFRLNTTTQMTAWVGLGNDSSWAWSNYLALYYDATSAASTWHFRTGEYTGGSTSDYDTTITADTNWHTFCIRGDDSTARKVWMRLDGTEKSFCSSGCDVTATIVNDKSLQSELRLGTKESVNKQLYLDYYGAKALVKGATASQR